MMKTATRLKAIRHLVSALISGVFTDREVEEISSALVGDKDFVCELGLALREVSQKLSERSKVRSAPAREERLPLSSPSGVEAARLVKQGGITQRELLNIIREISPQTAKSLDGKRMSTMRMLDRFLVQQDDENRTRLLTELARHASRDPVHRDPYLDLITEKLEH